MNNNLFRGLVCLLVMFISGTFAKTMDRYTTRYDFASNVFSLVGISDIAACSVDVELDSSMEWLCGHFESDFESFRTRWEEVLNSPNIILNYNVRPTSNWQGQSKTYAFNGDHLVIRFSPRVARQEVSISIRVNSQAAFQSDTATPSLQSPVGRPVLSNAQMIVSSAQNTTENTNTSMSSSSFVGSSAPLSCINLNTASAHELRLIAFIDEAKAAEIVVRRSIQAYRSVDELIYVTGIDEGQLNEIKAQNLVCIL